MSAVIYLLVATIFLLVIGWTLYVLPTPGPLSPVALMSALLPAFAIVFGLGLMVGGAWLSAVLGRHGIAAVRRSVRRHEADPRPDNRNGRDSDAELSGVPGRHQLHLKEPAWQRVFHIAVLVTTLLISICIVHAVIAGP